MSERLDARLLKTMHGSSIVDSLHKVRFVVIAIVLGVVMGGYALDQKPEAIQEPTELAIDQLKKSVVFITGQYEQAGQQKSSSGTGFFVFTPDSRLGENRGLVWLVTARHVLQQKTRPDGSPGPYLEDVTVRVNTREPVTPDGRMFAEVKVKVRDQNGNLLWFTDATDENADIALIRLTPDANKVEARWIPLDLIVTDKMLEELHINENDEVLFTGLWPWHPGRKKNYPIVRHGKLAMLPEERIPIDRRRPTATAELYLAEITSFGGNSGSPVFLRIGGIRESPGGPVKLGGYRYFLLGVMQGFFSEASEFAVEVRAVRGLTSQNSGIAAVVPAKKILKILDSAEVRAHIDTTVESILGKSQEKQP